MTICQLASAYCQRVGARDSYAHQFFVLARRLRWQAGQLSPDTIDAYLTGALATLSAATVAKHRRMLGCLMRFAHAEGLLDSGTVIRPLRRVKCLPPNPTAWSHAQIRLLLSVSAAERGGTRHCAYSVLLPAWILACYSTGLRRQDLLAIRHDALRGSKISVRQQKTGWPHVAILDPASLAAIRSLPKKGPRIFGDLISAVQIVRVMRRVVKRAGLAGNSKMLRRSGATYCEAAGYDASGHLGHKSPQMKVYYVDRLLLAEARPEESRVPPVLST
jgi:integrase